VEQGVAVQDPCGDVKMPHCLFYYGGDGICNFTTNKLKTNLQLTALCNDMNGYNNPRSMTNPWNCTKYGGKLQVTYTLATVKFICGGAHTQFTEHSGDGKPGPVTKAYTSSDPCKDYGMGSCPGSFTNTCVNFFFASCHGKENCLYADCATTGNMESGTWKLNQFVENPTSCNLDIENDKGEIVCKKK